jgi:hypothetical protein
LFGNLEQARCAGLFGANVYPGALGGSFYGPLLSPGTVHLATCFNAIHWLDRLSAIPSTDFETRESLYERIQARLLAEPERYSWRYILAAVQLTHR